MYVIYNHTLTVYMHISDNSRYLIELFHILILYFNTEKHIIVAKVMTACLKNK